METSILISHIQNSPGVTSRIAAIVQQAWWDEAVGDAASTVPLDMLAWAVACDSRVQEAVQAAETPENDRNVVERGVLLIPDELLYDVVVVKAIPRLTQPPTPVPAEMNPANEPGVAVSQ